LKSKLFVLVLVLVLNTLVVTPIAAAPLASPCAPGAAYDPACDANQDGAVNVLDVQLTAGHWNQTGTWLSDNSHDHLGQTWTGSNNPLVISGPFNAAPYVAGQPIGAPLVLGNTLPTQASSYGYGLRILDGAIGAVIDHAGTGVWVQGTDANGLVVNSAGANGLYVASATNDGVHVDSAYNGVTVNSATSTGVAVISAGSYGVRVDSSGGTGVSVTTSTGSGVYANTTATFGQWGFYTPDAIHGSNVLLQSLSLVAQVAGSNSLTSGDIVAVAGVADPVAGSTGHTPLVRLAGGTFTNVIGVVESHMALTQRPSQPRSAEGETPTEATESELRTVDGPAEAGDYVAITVMGAALVKVQDGETILAGQRLTAGDGGSVRALQSRTVEGMLVTEGAPVIGVALEAPTKDGLVWVLVNPQ
jgi:hypothetical protein